MDNIVLDASVVLEWSAQGRQAEDAQKIHDAIIRGTIAAWAPEFLLVELVNILCLKKKLATKDVSEFIEKIRSIGINLDDTPVHSEIQHILSLVVTHKISAYDAQYLHLAQKLNCKLVSFDKKLLQIKDWVVAPAS